jgi:biopolymer transport protein ExbD
MPKRKRLSVMVPIASMGDIAFLLIIFFMVTSIFRESHIPDLEEAASVDIDKMKESPVSVVMDGNGGLWLQGKHCHPELLEGGVRALLEGREERLVMVTIDRRVCQDTFGPVFMSLSRADAEIALVGKKTE